MASLLTDSPSSGYLLGQWCIQFCIEHPEQFEKYLTDKCGFSPDTTNPKDLTDDMELVKGLLEALGSVTTGLETGAIRMRVFPLESGT